MIDVTGQINAVQRMVGSRTLAAGQARTVMVRQSFDTDVDDLWDACTSAERISRWFLPVTGDLRLGGRYQLKDNASGEIQQCNAPHAFTASWEYGGGVSWVEVRVREDGDDRAQLEIEHVAQFGAEQWRQFGPGAVGIGWDMAALGLAQHLTTGDVGDGREASSWVASEQGQLFMTLASERWRDASIAAGTDEDEAHAAENRVTAAYTSQ